MTIINDLQSTTMVSGDGVSANPEPKRRSPNPRKTKNADVRTREHLEPAEVDALRNACKQGSSLYPLRDECMVLLAARHGLRVAELVGTRWDQMNFKALRYFVRRVKGSEASMHILEQDEIRLLRRVYAQQRNLAREKTGNPEDHSPFVFPSNRGGPMTTSNFRKLISVLGIEAGIPFPVHPHQLRHACGFEKINSGWDIRHLQQWLGHRDIRHTADYCKLTEQPFEQYFVQGAKVRRHER